MGKNLDGKLARGKISVTLFSDLSGRLALQRNSHVNNNFNLLITGNDY